MLPNKRLLLLTGLKCVIALGLAVFFGYAFYVRYWLWRECIAEVESSCTEPGAWNATEGGMMWAVPSLGFFIWSAVLVARIIVRLKQTRSKVHENV